MNAPRKKTPRKKATVRTDCSEKAVSAHIQSQSLQGCMEPNNNSRLPEAYGCIFCGASRGTAAGWKRDSVWKDSQ